MEGIVVVVVDEEEGRLSDVGNGSPLRRTTFGCGGWLKKVQVLICRHGEYHIQPRARRLIPYPRDQIPV